MEDQGERVGDLPAAGGALGAPIVDSTTQPPRTAPTRDSGGASSSTSDSLTMTEFKSFMESFKSSMENSMKVMVSEEVNKKLASLSHAPSTSATFVPHVTQDVDGTRETLQQPRTHTAPSYNVASPSYAPLMFLCRILIMLGLRPLWLLTHLLSGN